MTRREQAIEAAVRAHFAAEQARYDATRGPDWEKLPEEYREQWRRGWAPIVDAVLAVPCDCADRLDAEAERLSAARNAPQRPAMAPRNDEHPRPGVPGHSEGGEAL